MTISVTASKYAVTDIVIRHYHETSGHCGVEMTVTLLREKYWVLNARRTVKSFLSRCVVCKKAKPRTCTQQMADLPSNRVNGDEPPFSRTGVDFFSPFLIKSGRSSLKRYGCLFTCLFTRAIHVEVAHSLDRSSFINDLQRFMCRRGNIKVIKCVNGTNFVGTERELRKAIRLFNRQKIANFLLSQEIEWKFNTQTASLMGGAWERMIRCVRQVLQVLLKEQRLDDEGLTTVMCQAENIVNSRPLTHVSEDTQDPQLLTPNHLLHLQATSVFSAGIFDEKDIYSRRRWRQVAYLSEVFWRRWCKQYVTSLQCRHKW